MKKLLVVVMALMMLLAMAACGTAGETGTEEATGFVGMANPWTDYASLEEAEAAAGFAMKELSVPGAEEVVYRAMSLDGNETVELIYYAGETELLRARKAVGSDPVDGDYTEYESTEIAELGGVSVTLEGDGDTVSVATWTQELDGESYSYAITCEALAAETVAQYVRDMMD